MRIQLPKPEKYCFKTTTIVRINDLNYANHLSNDKLLCYAHQARVELFESWGQSELDFGGTGIIMTDAAVIFQAEGHLNDLLQIEVAIKDISRVGFDLYYQVSQQKSQQAVALIKTGIVCFDYQRKKVARIPSSILPLLEQAQL